MENNNIIYYTVESIDWYNNGKTYTVIKLSSDPKYMLDSDYEFLQERFEKDFPEYQLEEEMESIWDVFKGDTIECPSVTEVLEKLQKNPYYKKGEW